MRRTWWAGCLAAATLAGCSHGDAGWRDRQRHAVSSAQVSSPEYCVDGVQTLQLGDSGAPRVYIRDPKHQVDSTSPLRYSAHSELPVDAKDTGWHRDGRELWTTADPNVVYLVAIDDPKDVQRWPQLEAFCD